MTSLEDGSFCSTFFSFPVSSQTWIRAASGSLGKFRAIVSPPSPGRQPCSGSAALTCPSNGGGTFMISKSSPHSSHISGSEQGKIIRIVIRLIFGLMRYLNCAYWKLWVALRHWRDGEVGHFPRETDEKERGKKFSHSDWEREESETGTLRLSENFEDI